MIVVVVGVFEANRDRGCAERHRVGDAGASLAPPCAELIRRGASNVGERILLTGRETSELDIGLAKRTIIEATEAADDADFGVRTRIEVEAIAASLRIFGRGVICILRCFRCVRRVITDIARKLDAGVGAGKLEEASAESRAGDDGCCRSGLLGREISCES